MEATRCQPWPGAASPLSTARNMLYTASVLVVTAFLQADCAVSCSLGVHIPFHPAKWAIMRVRQAKLVRSSR